MNNSFKVIFILVIITNCYTWWLLSSIMKRINNTVQTSYIDLPEEISQANNGDTLYCIKRNDTLFIQFK